ncbi:MAG: response regulator transcription factor [Pleurocapsa sp.]
MPLLVLIAEDDPAIRLVVHDYLEMSGYSVVTAADGEEALSKLDTYHPHLLISDIKMPNKNGYELVKKIRQLPKFRLLPVIFLTEYGDTDERILGYQAGCDIYLPKPFEMKELGAVIRNLLERSQIIHSELRLSHEKEAETSSESSTENSLPNIDLHAKIDLTKREQEVLDLLLMGHSNVEIGSKLHLSHRTIEKYVSSLLRKTERNNRMELIRFAMEHNLINS